MADKATPAGWVIQVMIASNSSGSSGWIGPVVSGAPSFQYFNVAISDPVKAVEATRKHLSADKDAAISSARSLSSSEIASIPLKTGEVKPA